jgi:uncharacterized OB-fold protein/acyl dehydratase
MSTVADDPAARLRAVADNLRAAGQSAPRLARDQVNLPMIRNWVEAIGDSNPVYTDAGAAVASVHGHLVAPPAMTQVWTMLGLRGARDSDDPTGRMVAALDQAGYTGVVATNSDQTYHRYLRHGEQLAVRVALLDLTGPKRTALGEGWFFTTRSTWYSVGAGPGDGETVATMDFRILKFRPGHAGRLTAAQPGTAGAQPDPGAVLRPAISPDTAFFWAGTAVGELRIQRCAECGALRHPPGPMCTECGAARPGYVVAAGTGQVFSYVVHHHPPVPGKRLPLVIALVELDEGVRMVAELVGAEPDHVRIGMRVKAGFTRIDGDLTLPVWRPAPGTSATPGIPDLSIDVTPTFVIASALATRDFTPVHHDVNAAAANGSKDVFLNILTDTGLVQRFVTDWAGPGALVRRIRLRLGVPCYAGDTLVFSGQVTGHAPGPDGASCEVAVTGRCGLGEHVIGTVLLDVPGGPP